MKDVTIGYDGLMWYARSGKETGVGHTKEEAIEALNGYRREKRSVWLLLLCAIFSLAIYMVFV